METLLEYKCPCCGGAISFDSGLQKMKCPYCDTEFDVETLKEYDKDLNSDKPDELSWNTDNGDKWDENEAGNMHVYVCSSCGGEIICDETTAATSCPYCGNPVVMTGNLSGQLKPDCIIPFKLNKEQAKEKLRQHMEGKRLLPKVFKSENHIDEIKGIYVPFWMFDATADADMRYKATKVRVWSDSRFNYTETSFYSVCRAGELSFEKIPADGSKKMPDDLMESIEPFDFSEAVDFQTAYLAGYFADKYDVSAEDSTPRINERVKRSAEEEFSATIHNYATVVPESSSVRLKDSSAKYALLPVWILNTTWKNEKYLFAMNGQTGKFVGNLPMDKSLFWKWFGGIAASSAAAVYVIGLLAGLV